MVKNTQIISLPYNYLTGCNIVRNSNRTFTISLGQARDSTNSFDILVSNPIFMNINFLGINGLDQGTIQPNLFYYFFVIGSSTGVKNTSAILSLSSTSPVLPSGYDLMRLIGVWNTDSSSNFYVAFQFGKGNDKIYYYDNSLNTIITSGNSTNFTSISSHNYIPPFDNTIGILLSSYTTNSIGNAFFLRPALTTHINGLIYQPGLTDAHVQTFYSEFPFILLSGSPSIEYRVTASSDLLTIAVIGYKISL